MNPTTAPPDVFYRLAGAGSEARFAARLVGFLDEESRNLPPGVEARLRFAREQAVARASVECATAARPLQLGSAMAWIGSAGWWPRAAALLPLVGLVAGLVLIEQRHREDQVNVAVEIDAGLLTDDAPLLAYRDAGFVEFLKSSTN